jgi:hypothetical protein
MVSSVGHSQNFRILQNFEVYTYQVQDVVGLHTALAFNVIPQENVKHTFLLTY